jgi:hypothetical protein
MTRQQRELERLKFESHFSALGWDAEVFERSEIGVYRNASTFSYWLGWLACASLVPFGCVFVPEQATASQIAAALPFVEQPPSVEDHETGSRALELLGPAGAAMGKSVAAELARDYRNLVAAARLELERGDGI